MDERRAALLLALVSDKHRPLYWESAVFKHRIDALALLLPAIVDGLAMSAATLHGNQNPGSVGRP